MINNTIRSAFPLRVLPRKLIYRFQKDLMKKQTAFASVGSFRMELPLQEPGIASALMIYGERELDQRHILFSLLKSGDTIVDLGANIGYYCLLEAEKIGKKGRIYAFEPDQRNVEMLTRNLRLNKLDDMVDVRAVAISNINGLAKFYIAAHSNLNSMEITRGDEHEAVVNRGIGKRKYIKEVDVSVLDFGQFLSGLENPVDLVRMDIEGHEVQVLSSLKRMLEESPLESKGPKSIVFEPHSWEYEEGHDLNPILVQLQEYGYRISKLGSRNESKSPMHDFGYKPYVTLKEKNGRVRGVYCEIRQEDAIELASRIDGVTTVCLQREG